MEKNKLSFRNKIISIFSKLLSFNNISNLINLINYRKFEIKISKSKGELKISDNQFSLNLSHPLRIIKYSKGIQNRINYIKQCYLLDVIDFKENDLVVDVGANIGELYVALKNFKINYYGIEPNNDDFKVLKKNVEGTLLNKAIWQKNQLLDFYQVTEHADSSLIKNNNAKLVKINAVKLDSLKFTNKIKLLKIDCEGSEPEALRGAMKTLKNVEYLTIDVSYERNNKSTKNPVKNILKNQNFLVLDEYYLGKRNCILFKNKKFVKNKKHLKGLVLFGQNGWTAKFENICSYIHKQNKNISFDGIFTTAVNKKEFDHNNKINFINKKYIQDKIYDEYLKKKINFNIISKKIEKKYNISLWQVALAERRYCDNLFNRRFSIKVYSHKEILERVVIIFIFLENIIKDKNFILLTKPSSSISYALCIIAKYHNIKVRILDQVGQPNDLCTLTDTAKQNWSYVNNQIHKRIKLNNIKKAEYFLKRFRKDFIKPPWLIQGIQQKKLNKYINLYKIKNLFNKDTSTEDLFSKLFNFYQFLVFNFKRFLYFTIDNKFNREKKIDNNFFYYPLHVEPESSLMIDGPLGINQFSLIQKICNQLPINCELFVKEHPNMIGWRKFDFYKKVQKIKNLKIISSKVSSEFLIKKSLGVFVVSGTTGWEALLNKKPVISFGSSFYRNLPMVYKCNNIDEIYKAFDWLDNTYNHDDKKLINFIASVYESSIPLPYQYYWGISDSKNTWNELKSFRKYSYNISKFVLSKI